MTYIVVDTCVFVRLPREHAETLDGIRSNRDIIAVSKQAQSEYEVHFKPSRYLLLVFLQKLEREKILRKFKSSYIESALRRFLSLNQIHYPEHNSDRKWVELAVVVDARYILSTDHHLLCIHPNTINNHRLEAIEPSTYIETSIR